METRDKGDLGELSEEELRKVIADQAMPETPERRPPAARPGGALANIGAARRKQESRAKDALSREFGKLLQDLATGIEELREENRGLRGSLVELIRANNSAALVVGCVERHLDETAPGWDRGARADVEKRAKLLEERSQLARAFAKVPPGEDEDARDRRADAGARLWDLAKELGTEAVDAPMVLALLVGSRHLESARAFCAELSERANADLKLDAGATEAVARLERRLRQLEDAAPPALTAIRAEPEAEPLPPPPDGGPPETPVDAVADCAPPVSAPLADPEPTP
jgi:hypothetical protein